MLNGINSILTPLQSIMLEVKLKLIPSDVEENGITHMLVNHVDGINAVLVCKSAYNPEPTNSLPDLIPLQDTEINDWVDCICKSY